MFVKLMQRKQGIAPGTIQCAPRRWQFDGGISFRLQSGRLYQSMDPKIAADLRPRTGQQSTHLWWPAVAKLQAASMPIA